MPGRAIGRGGILPGRRDVPILRECQMSIAAAAALYYVSRDAAWHWYWEQTLGELIARYSPQRLPDGWY